MTANLKTKPVPAKDMGHSDRFALYQRGRTDAQIAEATGTTRESIRQWRKREKLQANGRPGLSRKLEAERLALYRRRFTDCQIARINGVDTASIRKWRKLRGLASNGGRGVPKGQLNEVVEAQRMRLYKLGRTDRQMAAALVCTARAIYCWRQARSLDANDGSPSPHGPTRFVSIDADLGEGGFNLHGLIADDEASEWLEEMGATRW